VIVRPGGLTPTAHAVHIIAAILTCGIWLIPYAVIALAQPIKRVEVNAPYGTPPEVIEQARRAALQLTPAELVRQKNNRTAMLLILIIPVGVCLFFAIGGALR